MHQMNHLEIYRLLDKTNCRQCELPTCLAFAAAVMRGEKPLSQCPFVDRGVLERFEGERTPHHAVPDEREKGMELLRSEIRAMNLPEAANRLGALQAAGGLTVKCLGKDFHIDGEGNIRSECHKTPWLVIPLLSYVARGAGKNATGNWLCFKELEGGTDWGPLFGQRAEKPLKKLIDCHTDLFEILFDLFDGELFESPADCDISIVIHPLPKVPVLIRYWKKEGDFDSALTWLFDATAGANLGIEPLYMICVGLVTMFERIALTHGRLS
ncbi:MAG: DUF3786 domain-containing protein [Syntrophobacteraceae bacterium]